MENKIEASKNRRTNYEKAIFISRIVWLVSTIVYIASLVWGSLSNEDKCFYHALATTNFDRPSLVEMCQE